MTPSQPSPTRLRIFAAALVVIATGTATTATARPAAGSQAAPVARMQHHLLHLAQAAAPQPASDSAAIGGVASVTGAPTVTRGDRQLTLSSGNEIFKGDVLRTGNDGGLGVTFDDETTLTLGANTQVTVNDFVYRKANAPTVAVFNVARGTLAFVAGQAAKTGEMKIATPSASLGIRGTTGVVDVPVDQGGAPGETKVKLYQDQNGAVGRIEIFDNAGARLALLSQASTGFAIRLNEALSRSMGQPRFAAVAFRIAPQELARDRSQVRALFSVHTLGRQIINLRRGIGPPGLQRLPNLQGPPGLRQGPGRQRQPALRQGGQPRLQNLQVPGLQRTAPNLQRLPGQPRKPAKQRPGERLPGVPPVLR